MRKNKKNKKNFNFKNTLEEKFKSEKELDFYNYSQGGASLRKNAFRGQLYPLQTADEDIGDSKETLMARSIDQYMNNPLGNGSIRKLRTNIIGKGLILKPTIDNTYLNMKRETLEKIQKEIVFLWNIWTKECDLSRTSNFGQLQSLVIINQLIYGETFVLMPMKKREGELFDLKIQLIESTRCIDPGHADGLKIKNGVEMDLETGEVKAYYFTEDSNSSETVRISAYGEKTGRKNVLCCMEKERINQRRGVPVLAPVLECIHQIGKYAKSEVMAAVVTSLFTLFLETKVENNVETEQMFTNAKSIKDQDGDLNIVFGTGAANQLPPGMTANFVDPSRPNVNFDKFLVSISKLIGASLEIPHEVLLSSFNSSYSASRAALAEAWKSYLMRRSWFIDDFCNPIYEEFLDEVVMKGYIKLPGYFENPLIRKSYSKAEWYGPTQASLDPFKEAKAMQLRIQMGVSTTEREIQEFNGGSFESNHAQRVIEETKRRELRMEEKNGKNTKYV